MKYFINVSEKNGSSYYEFYKGKWDGSTFWKEDSLLMHDDIMFIHGGFEEALVMGAPHYDPFGQTEISKEEWIHIGELIPDTDKESKEIYDEADKWLKKVFLEHDCFTILGL